jgi:hypothetical protein
MRYVRIHFGSEWGDPGLTLYEVDNGGWIHRQIQLHDFGARFGPEDILVCFPIDLEALAAHPATEEIDGDDFEVIWAELETTRDFLGCVPDPTQSWEGDLTYGSRVMKLRWAPTGSVPPGWIRVPGFTQLFVYGDGRAARHVCSAVFAERPISWKCLRKAA